MEWFETCLLWVNRKSTPPWSEAVLRYDKNCTPLGDSMLTIFKDVAMDNEEGTLEKTQNINGSTETAEEVGDEDVRTEIRAVFKKWMSDFQAVKDEFGSESWKERQTIAVEQYGN
jgi:hypothetical protein